MPARVLLPASPPPTLRRMAASAVCVVFVANALLVALMWIRHGLLTQPASLAAGLMAIGQLSALGGTYLALAGLVLVARTPLLEQLLGDRAARYHRLIGFSAITLITLHVLCSVAGYAVAERVWVLDEFTTVVIAYPYMLAALAGLGLFLAVGISSMRFIRARISYETWTGIHLYAYLALILAFGHQLAVGSDFAQHPLARVYWIGLYGVVLSLVFVYRLAAPIRLLICHRFTVARVVLEAPDVVSFYVSGRNLDRLQVRAGQYFRLRLLARNEWWRSHPFSISAMPDGQSIRFTVKSLGDFTMRLQSLRPGTRVMLSGPYGALTSTRRTVRGVALIGGGIGVTPIRALFEEFAGNVDVKLIYRASRTEDVVFWSELDHLSRQPEATVSYVIGRRGQGLPEEPLNAAALRGMVPDIAIRDVYVCGPVSMMDAVERSLRELGVPRRRVHTERFAA